MTCLWCCVSCSAQSLLFVEVKRFEALVVRLRLEQVFAGRLPDGEALRVHNACAGGEGSMVKPGLRE